MDILLQKKEVMNLKKLPEHLSVKCLAGRLWVTCEGSAQDTILDPGMSYHGEGQGTVLVVALDEARFCLVNAKAQPRPVPAGVLFHA